MEIGVLGGGSLFMWRDYFGPKARIIGVDLNPNAKTMKTQDSKSIFIELGNEGWKFSSENYQIEIDKGLYFGKKNTHIENQNIFISGVTNSQNNNIKWELIKIK